MTPRAPGRFDRRGSDDPHDVRTTSFGKHPTPDARSKYNVHPLEADLDHDALKAERAGAISARSSDNADEPLRPARPARP
jgi:hypothetical protein